MINSVIIKNIVILTCYAEKYLQAGDLVVLGYKKTSCISGFNSDANSSSNRQWKIHVIKYIHVNDLLEELQEESNLHVDLLP